MTLKIVKGQPGEGKLIRLVVLETPLAPSSECDRLDDCRAGWAANALMSRLMIPDTCSLVGLLGPYRATSNYEEVLGWVSNQDDVSHLSDADLLSALELRFRRASDQFPEP